MVIDNDRCKYLNNELKWTIDIIEILDPILFKALKKVAVDKGGQSLILYLNAYFSHTQSMTPWADTIHGRG